MALNLPKTEAEMLEYIEQNDLNIFQFMLSAAFLKDSPESYELVRAAWAVSGASCTERA